MLSKCVTLFIMMWLKEKDSTDISRCCEFKCESEFFTLFIMTTLKHFNSLLLVLLSGTLLFIFTSGLYTETYGGKNYHKNNDNNNNYKLYFYSIEHFINRVKLKINKLKNKTEHNLKY